ncbi:histidine phosphatase family protein [Pseudomonadota bacterium]
MAEPVIIDLLRHGEVEGAQWAFRGSTDVPLSTLGRAQMNAVGVALDGKQFSTIASSPLQRCRLFAELLANSRNTQLEVLHDMREIDFGDWEGKGSQEIDENLLKQFWSSPVGFCPPGGESFDVFTSRIITSWEQWLDGADGEHRLLVAHGGVIRVLLGHLLNMPLDSIWRLHLPYASWSRVSLLDGQQPRVLFMNQESQA